MAEEARPAADLHAVSVIAVTEVLDCLVKMHVAFVAVLEVVQNARHGGHLEGVELFAHVIVLFLDADLGEDAVNPDTPLGKSRIFSTGGVSIDGGDNPMSGF